MSHNPTWEDLYNFIQDKVKENPDFLKNRLMIECVDPSLIDFMNYHNDKEQVIKKDAEGWEYMTPATHTDKNQKILFFTTTFLKDKIVTLNINY